MLLPLRAAAVVVAAMLMPGAGAASTEPRCTQHFARGAAPELLNAKLERSTMPLCYRAFAVLHSGLTRTPVYSAEHLTRESVAAARGYDQRSNRFHGDPRLAAAERAEVDDYAGSSFDRGHMAPSGDMVDGVSDYESFSLANIVPQTGALNRNSWAALEDYVRTLTVKLGEAYVVTGPLYEGKKIKALNQRVLVPTSTWKAIYVPDQGAGA